MSSPCSWRSPPRKKRATPPPPTPRELRPREAPATARGGRLEEGLGSRRCWSPPESPLGKSDAGAGSNLELGFHSILLDWKGREGTIEVPLLRQRMLMLRAARAASMVVAGAGRKPGLLPVAVAGLSSSAGPPSGGKRRKGQRRGEAKPQPQPQPLPGHSEIPSKKRLNARPAKDRKVRPVEEAQGPSVQEIELPKQQPEKPKRVVRWRCATGCGACCKLDKGPEFPTPDEVFADYPDHLQLYKSMIGPDGWCNNYDKSNRTCNIYEDRPFFCRVEPKVFDEFFGVPRSKFDKEACSACVDNIKMVYGQDSPELGNFKRVIREESSKHEASMNQVKLLDTTNAGT